MKVPAILLLLLAGVSSGSRILLMPFHGISLVNELANIGQELVYKGHQVHMLLLDKYDFMKHFKKSWSEINLVTFATKYPDAFAQGLEDRTIMFDYYVKGNNQLLDLRINSEGFASHCHNLLEDKAMEQEIRKLQIDIVLLGAHPIQRCYFVLPYRLGLPYISVITEVEPWLTRNPSLPSFVPVELQLPALTPDMTFWQRLQNTMNHVCWVLYTHQVPTASDELVTKYAPNRPAVSMDTLAGRSLLWFNDKDIVIDYPNPMMPNEINVGGLSVIPAEPLSPELEGFVSAAKKGLIVASFGGVCILPEYIMMKIVDAFKMTSMDYHIILRWHLSKRPEVPGNLLLLDYLPQNDLLAHHKTRLYVTHSGANGQFEALSHAVPMVNIPFFYDQMYNAKRADYHGFSTTLSIHTFTAKELYAAMQEVLSNPSYKDKISRASAIFNSQPMRPRERAAYWVEHVLEHGADHLRSTALDMPAYQYLMLDIAAFLVALFVAGIVVTWVLFKAAKRMIGM